VPRAIVPDIALGVSCLGPFDLPTTFATLWMDSSVQMMRAASAFWSGSLGSELEPASAPSRSLTSTAAPWWKAPETPSTLDPATWAAMWFPAGAAHRVSPAAANPWMAAWTPWLPPQAAPAPLGPMELWQRAWLQSMPQLASFTNPASVAAVPAPWQPVATAYRSANGHAMAAVLRTMADVVEPKHSTMDLTQFWLNPLGTRH
jgi:hypothetical protein